MDFNQTIEELTKKAEQGDPESQYILGRKYREGGVDIEDHDKAKYYFLKAASQNFSPAEFMLGIGEMNEKKAIEWLQKSAFHGYDYAYVELGKRYFHGRGVRKNCKKAIECYEKAAEFGDPSIQNEVASIFEYENEIKDYKKALKWYLKSAEQDFPESQEALGGMYEFGEGVAIDYKTALEWYTKAMDNGSAYAEYRIGILYYYGEGVEVDYKKAKELWEHVSEQTSNSISHHAKRMLGNLYFDGNGVERDYKKAFDYFKASVDEGRYNELSSMYMIGQIYEEGLGVEQNYEQALYWYKQAAGDAYEEFYEVCRNANLQIIEKPGDYLAQNKLGDIYWDGEIVSQDYKEAFKWYQKAAEQGYYASQFNLGWMYEHGQYVESDTNQAFYWYKKAADQNHSSAQYKIACMYACGEGVIKNEKLADLWFERAAENYSKSEMDSQKLYEIADKYYYGNGVSQNYKKAFKWFKEAAAQDNSSAQFSLADMYWHGDDIEQDLAQAAKWYEKAAKNGYKDAQYRLGYLYYVGDELDEIKKDLDKSEYWLNKFQKSDKIVQSDGFFGLMRYEPYKKLENYYFMANVCEDADYQCAIAQMYEYGCCGSKKNDKRAIYWYEKAAEQECAEAFSNLGYIYSNDSLFWAREIDLDKAKSYYEKAALLGDYYAQQKLAYLNYEGQWKTEKNPEKAFEWWEKAAQNDGITQNFIGYMYENGIIVAQDYKKAKDWYEKANTEKYYIMWASLQLGIMYLEGKGVNKDYQKAFEYINKAASFSEDRWNEIICLFEIQLADGGSTRWSSDSPYKKFINEIEKGFAKVKYTLGYLYHKGIGVEVNVCDAYYNYKKAADKGNEQAISALKEIVEELEAVANQDNPEAQEYLGDMYYDGIYIEQNYSKAFINYEKAANNNQFYAQYCLGHMYEYGQGVEKNIKKAKEWYELAAKQNYESAIKALKEIQKNNQ